MIKTSKNSMLVCYLNTSLKVLRIIFTDFLYDHSKSTIYKIHTFKTNNPSNTIKKRHFRKWDFKINLLFCHIASNRNHCIYCFLKDKGYADKFKNASKIVTNIKALNDLRMSFRA